jgi:hypothetical protein
VELADEFGRLDVDGVLILERDFLLAEDEIERFDVLGKFRELEFDFGAFVEVVKLKILEIADQKETRQFFGFQEWKVIERLFLRLNEIAPGGFVFDKKVSLPEQIDEAVLAAKPLHRLFEGRDLSPLDAEDLEEIVVERLFFARLVMRILPILREFSGADADFVGAERQPSGLESFNNSK